MRGKKRKRKMRAKTSRSSLYPCVSNAGDLTRLSVPWDCDRSSNDLGGRARHSRCFHGGKNAERADGAAWRRKERASSASEED